MRRSAPTSRDFSRPASISCTTNKCEEFRNQEASKVDKSFGVSDTPDDAEPPSFTAGVTAVVVSDDLVVTLGLRAEAEPVGAGTATG